MAAFEDVVVADTALRMYRKGQEWTAGASPRCPVWGPPLTVMFLTEVASVRALSTGPMTKVG